MTSDAESLGNAPLEHGGDLEAARTLFPGAPEPFLDLSTGINPNAYTMPHVPADVFTRLPDPNVVNQLAAVAAKTYRALSDSHVVVAPGTQSLLSHVYALAKNRRAVVLGPTYTEHLRVATLVGHKVKECTELDELGGAGLAIVVNPNNPDGRLLERQTLLTLAEKLRGNGGLLVVDEAFMDVGPQAATLAPDVAAGNIVVLRSFGKFFGLAGLRLGFALAAPDLAERLRSALGPWAVSGPALAVGIIALADQDWIDTTRVRVATAAMRLDAILNEARLQIIGGTSLFRTVRKSGAAQIFFQLGRAGILVRRFSQWPELLRFGLPGDEKAWERIRAALIPS